MLIQKLENIDYMTLSFILSCSRLLEQGTKCPDGFYLTCRRNHVAIEIIARGHESTLIVNTSIFHRARRETRFSNCFIYGISAANTLYRVEKKYLRGVNIFNWLTRYVES